MLDYVSPSTYGMFLSSANQYFKTNTFRMDGPFCESSIFRTASSTSTSFCYALGMLQIFALFYPFDLNMLKADRYNILTATELEHRETDKTAMSRQESFASKVGDATSLIEVLVKKKEANNIVILMLIITFIRLSMMVILLIQCFKLCLRIVDIKNSCSRRQQ